MLCAQTKNGDMICLPPYSRSEIEEMRKRAHFYCPTCNDKLIIKIGTEITPHFSHPSVSTCSGGGEGEIHERGKWLLYNWLKDQYEHVHLEYYIEETNRRPDIFLRMHHKKFAVEFQYSSVPTRDIRKRNELYQNIEIIPIWFLDIKYLKQRGKNTFIVDAFAKQFLCQPSNHSSPFILYFCTVSKQIISLQHISFLSLNKVLAKKVVYTLENSFWSEIFQCRPYSRKHYLKRWKAEKKKFRLQYRNGVGKQKQWLLWLYEHQLSIDYLPSMIHLPVKGQMFMKVQTWNWQSRLWYYLQFERGENNPFSLEDCINYLAPYIYPPNYYPLLQHTKSPVASYIEWLCILGYVHQQTEQTFILKQSIPELSHIEEAIKQDQILMDHITRLYV